MLFEEFKEYIDQFDLVHFKAEELWRHNPPKELWKNIVPTIRVLDMVREDIDVPIYIVSTYRDPKYNKSVKGKKNSLHLDFNAVDFVIKDRGLLVDVWKRLSAPDWQLIHNNKYVNSSVIGLGIYNTFVHLDTRGLIGREAPSYWDERT